MSRLGFYIQYAWKNISRGGRWSALAILCIVAGVATVIALRSLGYAIEDSLINSTRVITKGDIRVQTFDANGAQFQPGALAVDSSETQTFTVRATGIIDDFAQQTGATTAFYMRAGNFQITRLDENSFGRPQFISTIVIDPATYPPPQTIYTIDPAGVALADVFTGGNDIVISSNMAANQSLSVGDEVRISTSEQTFTVRGIVNVDEEATVTNILAGFFGFAYLEFDDARRVLGDAIQPNTAALLFPSGTTPETVEQYDDQLQENLFAASQYLITTRSQSVIDSFRTLGQVLGDFIVVMGLGALLIGGVGIMNTMLVMVRRRTIEIASLKTFGLRARQITAMFFIEALMLGVIGSVIGMVVGVALSAVVNQYGATLIQQSLDFRIYPSALLYGLVLGLVITAIFGIAPILMALRVRPGIILRPNESHVPRLGVLQNILLAVIITLSIGLVVGQILEPSFTLTSSFDFGAPYLAGIIGVAITLVILGVLVMLLWVVVWLVGKLPSFGWVDLQLALSNLSTNRTRTATTLLALSAGMFALSSITLVGEGTRALLNLQLPQQFGGNVLVFPVAPGATASLGRFAVDNAIGGIDGIDYVTNFNNFSGELVAIEGEDATLPVDRSSAADSPIDGVLTPSEALRAFTNAVVWDTEKPDIYASQTVVQGRNLTSEDRGSPVMLAPLGASQVLGIGVGDTITYQIDRRRFDVTVVGMTEAGGLISFGQTPPVFAPGIFGDINPTFQILTLDVQQEAVNETLTALSSIRIPPTFSLDVQFLDSFVSRVINQFAAIPTVVGLLSLFAAAVIMANTVALATLERRRQIGILKSIGLKNNRVLRVMLIESLTIGLLSAILGIGLSAVFLQVMTDVTGVAIPVPRDAQIATILLLLAALGISALSTFLSANVAVRERVMNVLRYE